MNVMQGLRNINALYRNHIGTDLGDCCLQAARMIEQLEESSDLCHQLAGCTPDNCELDGWHCSAGEPRI